MPRGHGSLSMWGIPIFDRIQRARVMSQPVERFGELNSMMTWAEAAARDEHVLREEADRWSLRSHEKACAAIDSGKFREEIVPVPLPKKKGEPQVIDTDEPPRRDTTFEKLSRLAAVYPEGICTAGNSSSENDGAAAVVLMTEKLAGELGLEPLGFLKSFAVAASDPTLTYPAVPKSVDKALAQAGLAIGDMDLIEIQEAFAAQVLADARLMKINEEDLENKVNVNGSGISLGHPIAATGTMRMVTLLHELKATQRPFRPGNHLRRRRPRHRRHRGTRRPGRVNNFAGRDKGRWLQSGAFCSRLPRFSGLNTGEGRGNVAQERPAP